MTRTRVSELARAFRDKRILVVGDLMLDEFIEGRVNRVSPEAPVPVVEVTGERFYPGGAANVARNLREFCSSVYLCGITGSDLAGERLSKVLDHDGIRLDAVLTSESHTTTVKTRIVARHQQVVRVDREVRTPMPGAEIDEAIEKVSALLPTIDAVIVSDYAKGFLAPQLAERLISACTGKLLTVDPNPNNPVDWSGVTAVKPNRNEAFFSAGKPWSPPADPPTMDHALLEVCAKLLKHWDTKALLVTLGEQGMMLFEEGKTPFHTPTRAKEVFDVSGAGDTAIALFTLALAAGATFAESAEVANHASGVVVGKLGTATVTSDELVASFQEAE